MGKTVPTYRNQLEAEVRELLPFRRALREDERALFDGLINHARSHSAEGSFTAHSDPIVPFFLSILLEQERRIRELDRAVAKLLERDTMWEEMRDSYDDGEFPPVEDDDKEVQRNGVDG